MDWTNFLSNLKPVNNHQGRILLDRISNFPTASDMLKLPCCPTAPDIFWYPGSGKDMVPLLLDVPNNPTNRRLYRINQKSEEKPLLFWMNDYCESLKDFPDDSLLGQELVPEYRKLWEEYGGTISIGKNKESYLFDDNITITLFTANVRNKSEGIHSREETGDEYLICFSSCDTDLLLRKIFAPYRFHLSMIALIKQNSHASQGRRFAPYTDLPDRMAKLEKKMGPVDFWVIDRYGQNDEMPTAKSLGEYEYIGGPLPWGWSPARLYGRLGISYSRENRPCRRDSSWRNLKYIKSC